MKNKILITITTLNGSKQYTITQLLKKFIIFVLIGIFIFLVASVFVIKYLDNLVEKTQKELILKDKEIKKLQKEKNKLKENILDLESQIAKKEKYLSQINDKIADIENLINFNPPKNLDINEKLKLAKLSLIDKKFILQNIPNGYPIVFKGITSKFGWRFHPILKKREFHPAVDLRAKMNTPIYATADGIVEYAAFHRSSGYGKLIIIDHNFGFKTLFGHLNKIVVKRGDFVKKGQLIGYTGNSGLSNGPHLHYEIRYIGVVLNPIYFMKWNLKNYEFIFQKERKVRWQSLLKAIMYQKRLLQQLFQKEQK